MQQIIRDEKGKLSAARLFLAYWLAFVTFYLVLFPAVTAGVLALFSTVTVSLITWAAGPRIAQYLGPQVGKIAAGIRDAVAARRDASEGTEDTA